jgi:hypothetical protein
MSMKMSAIFQIYTWKLAEKSFSDVALMRVNSTNVQYEELMIGELGLQMNSKVKSVKQGVYRK